VAINILIIETPTLGDRSYLIHDGLNALVVDPQRDIDRIEHLLLREGLVLKAVAETHIHNDYLTGGLELSRKYSVSYILHTNAEVGFEKFGISDQETFTIGDFAIKALHTPGHTFTHMSYQIIDAKDEVIGLTTGGSLLHGSTGRPDLLGWDNAPTLAQLQFESAHRIVAAVPDEVPIFPTHGFGSFCSATSTTSNSSTIGDQRKINPVLIQDKATYIKNTLQHLDAYPNYFARMMPTNSIGPRPINFVELPQMTSQEVEYQISAGSWVVDLRTRSSYLSRHVIGSTNLGLDGSMASYLGWIYPYDQKLILISDLESDVSDACRELLRIGIDHPLASYVGAFENFKEASTLVSVKFKDIKKAINEKQITILDVRQNLERQKSFITDSIHIPFYEIWSRINELPTTGEIWVHCASGYRAASVLGVIEKSGRNPVLIDDDFSNAKSHLNQEN
jgi:glyoxylase-like metal-dependent hydrolase (beta-lactamase superfamily II)/rhodanese-related sulfurtransferase